MVIGITGQIGAGKSEAASILRSLGGVVVDADEIGRQVVEEDPEVLRRLVETFGESIIGSDGTLDRSATARLAFSSEESRQRLNAIVHPALLERLRARLAGFKGEDRLVVVDAALLLEWKLDRELDYVIAITAPVDIRVSRMQKRGFSAEDIRMRQARQFSQDEFENRADFVVSNSSTRGDLRAELESILAQIGFL